MELNNVTLRVADDLVVMSGMLGLTLQKAGEPQPQSLRSIVTQIWTRGPDAWQLLLSQATRSASRPCHDTQRKTQCYETI